MADTSEMISSHDDVDAASAALQEDMPDETPTTAGSASEEVIEATPVTDAPPPALHLAHTDHLDFTGLDEEQIKELRMRYAAGVIDLKNQAEKMKLDVSALDASLTSFNRQADQATKDGYSATIQHSQTTSIGRTEIIIGNTKKAASGKLSASASGESGHRLQIILIIVAALIFIAALTVANNLGK